jgi:hypothetical protein
MPTHHSDAGHQRRNIDEFSSAITRESQDQQLCTRTSASERAVPIAYGPASAVHISQPRAAIRPQAMMITPTIWIRKRRRVDDGLFCLFHI